MTRNCDTCGAAYVAQSSRSRFCSTRCRVQNHRKSLGREYVLTPPPADPLLAAVRADLVAAGRLNSVLGQAAVRLAEKMSDSHTGAALAALSKELRNTMEAALRSAPAAPDLVDELRRRRDLMRG